MSASDYQIPETFSAKWVGYFAALWVLLIALSQIKTITSLVVALAWLIAIAGMTFFITGSKMFASIFPKKGNTLNG